MNLTPKRLLRSSRTLLGCGLAALAAAVATAEPASAQRRTVGDVWQVTGTRAGSSGSVSVSVGNRGASIDARFGNRHAPRGRYVTRQERVWVPGYDRQVWVPPVHEWRYDSCGRRHWVLVRAGYYRTECVPGRYETRTVQVWEPARPVHRHGNRVTHVGRRYRR